ncbi:venom dipeptidyl peptidase 4 isoform X2 [Anopheles coustani]|uniref:venom dipeptidyl peptidase 4 isoform X2 n=1 Tax=Anopheles coustani TaxID=139045 RepID=UPI0026599492|nr:venom dipeptidyl peptidase 4 isoform X2 [Anopheles coustani]XP_058118924.1 venom dipeptidyl peptidase 4 isoform X2 [Anopheles coustani]XP_058118925.1 venom dipeptidyl peptidase 4 isoform X2 [Anopheles coustani]
MAASSGNSIEIGHSDQELVGTGKKTLRWYLLLGTLAVILTVIAVALVVMVTASNDEGVPPETAPIVSGGGDPITLQDFLSGRLTASGYSGTWTSNGKIIYRDDFGAVMLYDPVENATRMLLSSRYEDLLQGFKFDLSPDGKFLLVARGYSKIFRHSYLAVYDIVDLGTRHIHPVNVGGERRALNLVEWGPVGHSFIFVHQNNLYYRESPTATEVQITTDGSASVYNGIPDWVYEEEVFSTNIATWFSPDGQRIAFIRFNDTQTPLMKIPIYGPPGNPDYQYPHELSLHYPKVGTKNPEVHLFQYDLREQKMQEVLPPQELVSPLQDHIITSVGWTNDRLVTIWMNRVQNHAIMRSCRTTEPAAGEGDQCMTVHEINQSGGWLDLFSAPVFNADGTHFLVIASQSQGSAGDYKHITMISTTEPRSVVPLTSGKFVVQEILKWDGVSNLIFYTANTEQESHVLHVYAIDGKPGATAQCLTCDVEVSANQSVFNAQMSPMSGDNYLVLEARGPNIPWSHVFHWSVAEGSNDVQLKLIKEWESNRHVERLLKGKALPRVEIHELDLGNGFTAKAMLLIPPGVNTTSADVKHPMLVDVYGGPNSANVVGSWSIGWGTHLASNRSVVYAKIDGRGSGNRGDRLMFQIYRQLGTVEVQDQITGARKLADLLPYVDRERIAIWGWSYGGYASAMALAQDTNHVFQCAVSVAPVTDWSFYDSIYTERYMGLPSPSDNRRGYEESRLTAKHEQFRNRSYMLVHGTYDDNVHFQQAMQLSRALETHDIQFKQVSYPDEDHSLAGVRPHLYHTLGKFFSECLKLD